MLQEATHITCLDYYSSIHCFLFRRHNCILHKLAKEILKSLNQIISLPCLKLSNGFKHIWVRIKSKFMQQSTRSNIFWLLLPSSLLPVPSHTVLSVHGYLCFPLQGPYIYPYFCLSDFPHIFTWLHLIIQVSAQNPHPQKSLSFPPT